MAPQAPVAAKIPHVEILHGDSRVDDYFWLRDKENPAVRAYLEAENAYSESLTAPLAPLREALYQEMLGRIKQTDLSVPYPKDGYWYYSRTEEGKQYPILCRKPGSLEAAEQITLDLNALAEGQKFLSVGAHEVSPDACRLAYSTDTTGFREYTLYVKSLDRDGEPIQIAERTGSVTWAGDSETLFYTVEDDAKRTYRLYRHRLGSGAHDLIYEETDERFRVGVWMTRSGDWLLFDSSSHTQSEVRYLAAAVPEGEWRLIAPREPDHEYDVDHHGNRFLIRTNSGGRNFRLVSAPVEAPGKENWTEILPHREEVMLEGVGCFEEHWVAWEREEALPHLSISDRTGRSWRRVTMPEPVYEASHHANAEFKTTKYRYVYQSLVTPASVYEYDMATGATELLKQTEVLGGYNPENYVSERVWAVAEDGVRVPISLVRRRDLDARPAPMLLYGYGAYGYTAAPTFASTRLTLLDRGITYAIAHVRGGGELGKRWHDEGRMLHKRNSFTDLIACAEHLIAQGYTAADRLVIEGGSAGGLLVGAAANLRPDLFHAVIAQVPFVDVLNTMLDETLPLTVGEFEEWGNPKIAAEYAYIRSYCPYTNLDRHEYPAMLVKTSFEDSQVMYHEPAKYVAKMRALRKDQRPLLLVTNMAGGHGGSSGRYDRLRETAFDYAFLLWILGLT